MRLTAPSARYRSLKATSRPTLVSRQAIDAAYTFARGGRRTAALRAKAGAAYTAAREAGSPADTHAARAASHAAAAAYLHPEAKAHQVKHLLGDGAHAARAAELAAGDAPQAGAEHLHWAVQHTPAVVLAVLRRFPTRAARWRKRRGAHPRTRHSSSPVRSLTEAPGPWLLTPRYVRLGTLQRSCCEVVPAVRRRDVVPRYWAACRRLC